MTKGDIHGLSDTPQDDGQTDGERIISYFENKELQKSGKDVQLSEAVFPQSVEHFDNEKHLDTNNNIDIDLNGNNIVNYVSNIQNLQLKRQITRILSIDEPGEIDIENIEHLLHVAKYYNAQNSLRCCEAALVSNLTHETLKFYSELAKQYDLSRLRHETRNYAQAKPSCPVAEPFSLNDTVETSGGQYQNFISLFTCNTCASNRSISVLVYDSDFQRKCSKDLKRSKKISNNFQCCCVQEDCDNDPSVFWSCGKSVYRYDPLLNKCKKRASLRFKRSKFNLVAYGTRCFAIGGSYKIKKVLEIEEYNASQKGCSWKKVAILPGDSLPISPSSVVCDGLIYIFSAILDIDGKEKSNSTAVYAFNPMVHTVKYLTEIPFSFNKMKTCAIGSNIYLASNRGHMIRFTPSSRNVTVLRRQLSECDNFGMFTVGTAVILTGGSNGDGKCNDTVRKYCTVSGQWETLPYKLPDSMQINGACGIKIPNNAPGIIPFCDVNLFRRR